jgi:[acyl-carrier-protein] S-malonyltransferase
MKKKLVVVCPGRGSYGKDQLGSLSNRSQEVGELVHLFDQRRSAAGAMSVTELDKAERFAAGVHTIGENASILIHSCALADFMEYDWDANECVAVIGNSMGWYTALAAAGAVAPAGSYELVNTMGSMMKGGIIGGQLIYPTVDLETWLPDQKLLRCLQSVIIEIRSVPGAELFESIRLGGYRVLAGNDLGVQLAMQKLPAIDGKYPFKLQNHGAFHTPLLQSVSAQGKSMLPPEIFRSPRLPLIDGRGEIWWPHATELAALRDYTLGYQVTETYDFSLSIEVALKEFAPDGLLLLGPGASLGGAIGQALVHARWRGMFDKRSFKERQETAPFLITCAKAPAV